MEEIDVIQKLSTVFGSLMQPDKDPEFVEKLNRHKQWLATIRHEHPSPQRNFKVGVYIRYFNQTKYEDYLKYHIKQFEDTIALCPKWTLVDFYIDEGSVAPRMESAKEWCRLLEDCLNGKVDLIITQKVSNVSRSPEEIAFVSRHRNIRSVFISFRKICLHSHRITKTICVIRSFYRPRSVWRYLMKARKPKANDRYR